MPVFYQQTLSPDGVLPDTSGTVIELNGLQLMRHTPVEAVFRAQDSVVGLARRIVASGGLRGSTVWRTPNTNPLLGGPGVHPTPDERRRIGGGSFELTPGCILRCWVVAVPSGETRIDVDTAGGAQGRIEVECQWLNPQTGILETRVNGLELPASPLQFGAEPSTQWQHHHVFEVNGPIRPLFDGAVDLWSRHVYAQVTIYAVGGARIVDAVVFESPNVIKKEADDAADTWVSHIYASPTPGSPAQPLLYPYQRFSETTPDGDPRGGTWHASDVHDAQHQRLGPILCAWSGALESSGFEAVSTSSTTFASLAGNSGSTFSPSRAGLAVGCGGYARRWASNSPFVLRDRVAAIPVIVRVLARSPNTTATVRVGTRYDSYVDVSIPTGSTPTWYRAQGWLEVGINPQDDARLNLQFLGRRAAVAAGTLDVYAVSVYYAGGYTPPL